MAGILITIKTVLLFNFQFSILITIKTVSPVRLFQFSILRGGAVVSVVTPIVASAGGQRIVGAALSDSLHQASHISQYRFLTFLRMRFVVVLVVLVLVMMVVQQISAVVF